MPRKARSAGWNKNSKYSSRFWNADAADPDSPTSIDVLLQWLTTPGNYQRWQTERKQTLYEEIMACMAENGLTHRTAKQVQMKLMTLAQTFENTTNWLAAHGHFAAFQRGETTKEVRKILNKRCPYYDELAVIFRSGSCIKSSTDPRSVADVPRKKVPSSEGGEDSEETEDDEELHSRSPHLPAKCAAARATPLSQVDGGESDCKLKLDTHSQHLLEIELKSKMTQLEADAICSVALNRKKMLDAGISQEE
ncbi:hypothetical protein PHYPSEUDO_009534, partial [Phytophthora pseudosyringae]